MKSKKKKRFNPFLDNSGSVVNEPKPAKAVNQQTEPYAVGFQYHLRDIRGCGHFRAFKPMLALNNLDHPIIQSSAFATDRCIITPGSFNGITFPVFQSVADKEYFETIRQLRRMLDPNQYLIYDTDDDLFTIPSWNFAADTYKPELLDSIANIMRAVDIVSVSTPYLAKVYGKYNSKIVVQPNRLIKAFWGEPKWEDRKNEKPRILYAGSDNHFSISDKDDRGDFSMDLIRFVESTLDEYQWVFVGGMPYTLRQYRGKEIEYYGWHSMLRLYPLLQSLNADMYLAPLMQEDFNKSKSNLKVLEATALGLPCICTDIEPYKGFAGACDGDSELIDKIREAAKSPDLRREIWEQQHNRIRPDMFWEENDNTAKYVNNFTREAFGFEVPLGLTGQMPGVPQIINQGGQCDA